jgi:crotonobetainyl-CoA:carnitine CoA-transferase CaiB-like acyl-CoA transferase
MHGLHVLDLSRVLAGPWATQHLADQGADVIKVEPPGGDETRGFGPFIDGHSTYFMSVNRNKRSIVLDLRTDAGRSILDRLLGWADVLVENYRPGVAERLGFGWTDVHPRYPRLCYVAIHAFGHQSDGVPDAWASRPGYDLVLQAMSGAVAATGFPASPPTKSAMSTADLIAGLYASQAALTALLERERTGRTQKIVINMLQAQATALAHHATRFLNTGEVEQQRGNSHRGLAPYDLYRCRDGFIAIACGNDAMWLRLVTALKLPNPPEWHTNPGRVDRRADVDAAITRAIATLAVSAVDERLATAGVPAGPVYTVDQTLTHPAVTVTAMAHPSLHEVHAPGPAFTTATTPTVHRHPPELGAHRDEILASFGYSTSAVDDLQKRGAFGAEGADPG